MGFSIELHFDAETEKIISALRHELIAQGLGGASLDYEYHPHITLGYFEGDPSPESLRTFPELAAQQKILPLQTGQLGIFITGEAVILYLGVTPSKELLMTQENIYQQTIKHCAAEGAYCKPDRWVPHITLAVGLLQSELGRAIQVLQQTGLLNSLSAGLADRLVLATERPIAIEHLQAQSLPLPSQIAYSRLPLEHKL